MRRRQTSSGVSPELLQAGSPLATLWPALQHSIEARRILQRRKMTAAAGEIQVADGRWLRVSQSATRDGGFIVVCSDISQSKEQKASLRQTNLRLDAALDNMSQGLCLFDAENRLEVVNRRFYEIFGLSRDLIAPGDEFRKILALSKAREPERFRSAGAIAGGASRIHEAPRDRHALLRTQRWTRDRERLQPDLEWRLGCDVRRRHRTPSGGSQIMHMARHDALTDLPNRVMFREKMEQALARGENLAVLFLDLDRFKTVNDSLGHPIGDALLCAVTKRLQMAVRGADTVARLGGDEFAIVQMGAEPSDASELAAALSRRCPSRSTSAATRWSSASASASRWRRPTANSPISSCATPTWRSIAPRATGAAPITSSSRKWTRKCRRATRSKLDLRKAMLAGEFENVLPADRRPRQRQGDGFRGVDTLESSAPAASSGPDDFIAVAEEIGLIVPLGEWVLRQACRDAAAWPGKLSVAVNLSAAQIQRIRRSLCPSYRL